MQGARLSDFAPQPYTGEVWRMVEAQHRVSTLKIVDTLEEQAQLEDMLEETKPTLPPECAGLDYLLATPFRYGSAYPTGSRFRRAGRTLGVFYASEKASTAVCEMAFYRMLFYAESPATPFPDAPADYNAFSVAIKTTAAIDISKPPHRNADYERLIDYAPCQDLADKARAQGAELIRYTSMRDRMSGINVALLTAKAFSHPKPLQWQSWRIKIGASGISALCDFPVARIWFGADYFNADPRLASFNWAR
jgi:hypothetical protein